MIHARPTILSFFCLLGAGACGDATATPPDSEGGPLSVCMSDSHIQNGRCVPNEPPPAWMCGAQTYGTNDGCDCGCGVIDPECPTPLTFAACEYDACGYGQGIDPENPKACIDHAPQDSWTCAMTKFYDGTSCDCGCGGRDPDCPANATAASCTTTNCGFGRELSATDIAKCVEHCEPIAGIAGTGTCTNDSYIEMFGACNYSLSRCGDGHFYEVECDGSGSCYCRVDGSCVAAVSGSCMGTEYTLNTLCGWHLVDGT